MGVGLRGVGVDVLGGDDMSVGHFFEGLVRGRGGLTMCSLFGRVVSALRKV